MPPVRAAIMLWQPKQQPELTQLLELWRPLLPRWILENVIDQLLMPRLQTEVDAWNPLTDAVPIHSWIHPWMPIMGEWGVDAVVCDLTRRRSSDTEWVEGRSISW